MAMNALHRSRMRRAAIFLDKDGTLLDDLPYNVDPSRMRLALTVTQALRRLGSLNLPLVVVSNQCGVAEGRFKETDLLVVGERLDAYFRAYGAKLSGFYWCPHSRDEKPACDCRKPAPGMLLRAASELNLDLSRSWMIGDVLDDVEAGRRAGCHAALIDNGHETLWCKGVWRTPHLRAPTLLSAVEQIGFRLGLRASTAAAFA